MHRWISLFLILLLSNCVVLKKHMREREKFLAKEKTYKSTSKKSGFRSGTPGLPTRIVTTAGGTKHMNPSLWMAQKKRFSNTQTHRVCVQKGDTVYALARKHGVPIRDIIQHNHLHPPFALKVGDMLLLSNPQAHKVAKGETLYSVARMHSVDVSALARRNKLKSPFSLSVGQELFLPGQISMEEWEKTLPTESFKSPARKSVPGIGKSTKPNAKAAKTWAKKFTPKRRYAKPTARTSAIFLKPVSGKIISHFGPLKNGTQNDGVNISAKTGTKVKAAENGVVVYHGRDIPSYGNLVLVKHADGWVSTYGHLKNISVKRGAKIKRGQTLGTVGSSGHVKIPQLHFELRKGRYPVNPAPYLSR